MDLTGGVVMGVLNVTPDSFSDGGLYVDPDVAVRHGLSLVSDGAEVVDVGGESTRPGSEGIGFAEETQRVVPVISELVAHGVTVSIDTSKPEVAAAALAAGAEMVNDVGGMQATAMIDLVADAGCGVVVVHMKGQPRDMHVSPAYEDVVGEVEEFLLERAVALETAGVRHDQIAIDPGIGFGKNLDHNLKLLRSLRRLSGLGYPLVLGTSRKAFLGALTSQELPADRDGATAVTTALGFVQGARVFRVHDVVRSRHALQIAAAIVAAD